MQQSLERLPLEVSGVSIAFGGIKAATDVGFTAEPGRITSLIGPNGAGKTTVLNIIGGFYVPDKGSIRLGSQELAGLPAWKVARAGVARTYQTTKLFETMSVLDNVLVALGAAGSAACCPASPPRTSARRRRRCLRSSATRARWRRRRATCRMSTAVWSRSRARSRCVRACCCWMSRPPG